MADALVIDGLTKDYRVGFWRPRPYRALDGLTLSVAPGEVYGFLGPNGAGRTTTLKLLMQLVSPTSGRIEILGRPPGDVAVKRRIGFLPENPYFYDYLTAEELLRYFAGLFGYRGADAEARVTRLLDELKLGAERRMALRKFSKGMIQRVGIAQALINDPELIVLDEPMSGLDPIGRKEVRDIILQERERGRTVMFSSHILSDVEMLCDRVAILNRGELTAYGSLNDLLRREIRSVEVELTGVDDALVAALTALTGVVQGRLNDKVLLSIEGEDRVGDVLALAVAHKAQVHAVTPKRETLEDLFVRNAIGATAAER